MKLSDLNLPVIRILLHPQILSNGEFRQSHQVTRAFIERLGLEKQLLGHEGCVNCVQWSDNGEYLASGNNMHIIIFFLRRSSICM